MEENLYTLNNKIYSNNNNILFEIINELQEIMKSFNNKILIKRLSDIIIKMNNMINDNKKNFELILNQITMLQNRMDKKFDELKINNNNIQQELKYNNGRYIGQVLYGLPEGKGICYGINGER